MSDASSSGVVALLRGVLGLEVDSPRVDQAVELMLEDVRLDLDDMNVVFVALPAPAQDFTHLPALAIRYVANVHALALAEPFVVLDFGFGAAVVARGHREAVGEQVGEAEDEDDTILEEEETSLKVGATIKSTRGPQPLWDILKRLVALKKMNVSWASDVDQNVLVDVDINANDDFYEAVDNLLRQVDYFHEVQGNTIIVNYKETRQFRIAMPFIRQSYATGVGGNVLGGSDLSTKSSISRICTPGIERQGSIGHGGTSSGVGFGARAGGSGGAAAGEPVFTGTSPVRGWRLRSKRRSRLARSRKLACRH